MGGGYPQVLTMLYNCLEKWQIVIFAHKPCFPCDWYLTSGGELPEIQPGGCRGLHLFHLVFLGEAEVRIFQLLAFITHPTRAWINGAPNQKKKFAKLPCIDPCQMDRLIFHQPGFSWEFFRGFRFPKTLPFGDPKLVWGRYNLTKKK